MLRLLVCAALLFALSPSSALAQNAVDVDPDHHRVVFEDDYVRIIRVTYPAGYTTPMHEHAPNVAVFVSRAHLRNTLPDGTTEEVRREPGDSGRSAGARHASENASPESFEVVMIEFKKTSPVAP